MIDPVTHAGITGPKKVAIRVETARGVKTLSCDPTHTLLKNAADWARERFGYKGVLSVAAGPANAVDQARVHREDEALTLADIGVNGVMVIIQEGGPTRP